MNVHVHNKKKKRIAPRIAKAKSIRQDLEKRNEILLQTKSALNDRIRQLETEIENLTQRTLEYSLKIKKAEEYIANLTASRPSFILIRNPTGALTPIGLKMEHEIYEITQARRITLYEMALHISDIVSRNTMCDEIGRLKGQDDKNLREHLTHLLLKQTGER